MTTSVSEQSVKKNHHEKTGKKTVPEKEASMKTDCIRHRLKKYSKIAR
jgi:hypothetical protein